GFVAYQLSVELREGLNVAAVDIAVSGPLHQCWVDVDFDGVADPTITGPPADGLADSHATPPGDALLLTREDLFTEDNNVSPSPLPDGDFDYGIGSMLRAVWGIPGASQTNRMDIAYLVIPADFPPEQLEIELAVAVDDPLGFGGALLTATTEDFFTTIIPEPLLVVHLVTLAATLATRRPRRRA
ncbi:hypothetical protein OAS39_08705, partial [Pirellulales bacterium]|nr:hypothetical protein [Pirellulales bacterium]